MTMAFKWRQLSVMLMIFTLVFASAKQVQADEVEEVKTNAAASALMDVTSGRLLYSEHGDEEMRIASLTKIMTAIVAIEHGNTKEQVTVGKRAVGKEGSSIYLKLGEQMTLQDMLYGLMLRSGNDAATAIAEHVGGSEEGFVYLMNQKAELLGLTHTHFMNPHGLDTEGHYSSANDLAKLTAYALKNPVFHEIVKTRLKKVPNPNESWDYTWLNKNKLLHMYEGADGVKTGFTKKALRCLVTSATRNDQQLVAVTLRDSTDWVDHQHLLDYGFSHFPLKEVFQKGQDVRDIGFRLGADFAYPFASDEVDQLQQKLEITDHHSQAYRLGERAKLVLTLEDQQIGVIPLYEQDSLLVQ